MHKLKVIKVKLGTPPPGTRTIVFCIGEKERAMIVPAPEDWPVEILVDHPLDPKEIFCVAMDPDFKEVRVVKMKPDTIPKKAFFNAADFKKKFKKGDLGPDLDSESIVDIVRKGMEK